MVMIPGQLCGAGHLELALGPKESLSPSKRQQLLYVMREQGKYEQPQLEEQGLVGHLWRLDKCDKKWVILLYISQKTWKLYLVGCVVLEEYPSINSQQKGRFSVTGHPGRGILHLRSSCFINAAGS